MQTSDTFENIRFDKSIYTIDAASYPTVFSLHWHKCVEVAALPETAVITTFPTIRINQITYELHPGDLLFIWPGELHETIDNNEHQLIGIQFPIETINEQKDFAAFLNLFRTYHHIRANDVPSLTQSMMQHAEHILSLQASPAAFSGVESTICLYEMFMDFATFLQETGLDGQEPIMQKTNRLMEKINQACNYINEHCEQELTLDSTADYIGFSSCYFSRVFKQTTGYNFVEYLSLQRVKHAQILLADSSLTITEVAYQSGFKSISTFNRSFRQLRGCSPREFKKYYVK